MTLPSALAHLVALKAWVIWKKVLKPDRAKPTKPPFEARPGWHNASTGAPKTWSTFKTADAIVSVRRPWKGIGFNLWGSDVIGIDCDHCVDNEGRIAPWALAIIERCKSYTELSPSGTGVRIFGLAKSKDYFTHIDDQSDGVGRLEVYRNAKRYLTITGQQIGNDELAELDDVLAELKSTAPKTTVGKGGGKPLNLAGGADSSTSGVFHKQVCKLFDNGLNIEEIVDKIRRQPKRWVDTKAGVYEKEKRLQKEVERCEEKWKESKGAALTVGWSNGRLPSKTLVADAKIALQKLEVKCRADRFHLVELIEGEAMGAMSGRATDDSIAWLRKLVWDEYKFDPGKENMRDAVHQLALEKAFDPVLDYVNEQQEKWDNKARIDRLAVTYFGCPDTEFNRTIGRLAMIAAVRRVRQPGCKFDQIIVLEGEEGTSKSTAIQVLAGEENFSDQSILGLRDREQQEGLAGRWLYEIADLKGINHAEVEAVKAFASRTWDRARPAFGHYLLNQPRRTILFATTNDKNYLKGDTGNRRWWPLPCGKIKINLLRRDRDQLWAEAAELEAQGESLMLPEHLWPDAKRAQEDRLEQHPWMEFLRPEKGTKHTLRSPTDKDPGEFEMRIGSDYLLTDVLKKEIGQQRVGDAKQVAALMRRLGWDGPKMLRVQRGSEPVRGYSRLLQVEKRVIDLDEERRRRELGED